MSVFDKRMNDALHTIKRLEAEIAELLATAGRLQIENVEQRATIRTLIECALAHWTDIAIKTDPQTLFAVNELVAAWREAVNSTTVVVSAHDASEQPGGEG